MYSLHVTFQPGPTLSEQFVDEWLRLVAVEIKKAVGRPFHVSEFGPGDEHQYEWRDFSKYALAMSAARRVRALGVRGLKTKVGKVN